MERTAGRFKLIEQFLADGLCLMFGNPGTVEQGFLDAAEVFPEFRYILGLHEGVAVGVADGFARATHRPALIQLHDSVGLGNGVSLLYQALRGRSPLVVIAGEAGLGVDAMEAQNHGDLTAVALPVVKHALRVVHPGSLLRCIRRAVKLAATPPCGPVFVSLPMDVLDATCTEEVVPTSIPDTRVTPADEAIDRAAALLGRVRRPLVLMGDGVAFSDAQPELVRMAELLGAPVWGLESSEVNMPSDHPLYRGPLGHMFGSHSRPIVSQADAVLICGTYAFPEVFPALDGMFAPGAAVIHIDLATYDIAKNFPVTIGLAADPKCTLARLAERLAAAQSPADRQAAADRLRQLSDETRRQREQLESDARAAAGAIPRMTDFAAELARLAPPDLLVFDEALTYSGELTRYIVPNTPGSYFQTRGGSLGIGIPGAIGAKLAHPKRTVIGFTGDGGAMYTIPALWTAARYQVAAKFVVCNNQSYRLLKQNIRVYWHEHGIEPHRDPSGFDLGEPRLDFVHLAAGMGVQGERIERPEQIRQAILRMLTHPGPYLIDLWLEDRVD
jgi:benzoylformate decarboxylase